MLIECYSLRPAAFVPESKWQSRRWPGWCARLTVRSTATTRLCTTRLSLTDSKPKVWCSLTTCSAFPLGARSCCRRTARHQAWWTMPTSVAVTWSTPCVRWSPRCITRFARVQARVTASCMSGMLVTKKQLALWRWRLMQFHGWKASTKLLPLINSANPLHCWPKRRCRIANGKELPTR